MQIDDEMERNSELLKEIQDSPTDINAVVARRRKDFTGDFFHYLTLLSETFDSLEDRDGTVVMGTHSFLSLYYICENSSCLTGVVVQLSLSLSLFFGCTNGNAVLY